MMRIQLAGTLICASPEERDVVFAQLDEHVRRSPAEPGSLLFAVSQTGDPMPPQPAI